MRRGYKFVRARPEEAIRTDIDKSVGDFVETMGYGRRLYPTREAFLQAFQADWILELRAVLKELLQKDRAVFGIGSGECEHEVPLFLQGYRVTASDIAPEAFSQTKQLFPDFPVRVFDIFHPNVEEQYDDVLITGLDSYYDGEHTTIIFRNARTLLKPDGRLLFALRYQDNLMTRAIDYVGIPAACFILNLRHRWKRTGYQYVLKFHGYRRTRREIVALAERTGFRLGRTRHASFGGELTRLALDRIFPRGYSFLRQLDHHTHWFNSITVFEFLMGAAPTRSTAAWERSSDTSIA